MDFQLVKTYFYLFLNCFKYLLGMISEPTLYFNLGERMCVLLPCRLSLKVITAVIRSYVQYESAGWVSSLFLYSSINSQSYLIAWDNMTVVLQWSHPKRRLETVNANTSDKPTDSSVVTQLVIWFLV